MISSILAGRTPQDFQIVASNTARDALATTAGMHVHVLSTDLLNIYDGATAQWVEVGKVIESQDVAAQTGGASADFTYNTATITLTPGRWEVQAGASLINTVTSDTASVGIWNNTAGAIVASSTGAAVNSTTTTYCNPISLRTIVVVTASTVYRPRCRRNGGSTIKADSANAAGAPAGWIRAICLGTTT